jgi:hypothetical protein
MFSNAVIDNWCYCKCPRKIVCYCRAGLVVVVIKRDRRTGVIAIPHQNAFVGIVVKRVLLTVGINNNKTGGIAMTVKCHLFLSAQ